MSERVSKGGSEGEEGSEVESEGGSEEECTKTKI